MNRSLRSYLAELVGTFALVFCGTGAIIINQENGGAVTHLGIAITFGLIVSSMIFAFGDISGAHFNPAVTLAFYVAKIFPRKEIIPYVISQIIGGCLASVTLYMLFPNNLLLGSTQPAGSAMQSFVLELLLTYFLMLVILFVAFGAKEKTQFAGLIIGAVVLLEALFAGPISGASMNPVRSLAPAMVSGHLENLWIYIFAPILGALIAVGCWRIFKPIHI